VSPDIPLDFPEFCRIVGDNSLLWHLQTRYEGATKKKATDSAVA
jgi:hypothetical protein